VGADAVRTRCGAGGEGIRFVDVEEAWRRSHPAYSAHAPAMATTPPLDNRDLVGTFVGDHGTAVLGIVAATGQGVRVRGVAPRLASVLCSSHYDAATGEELHTVDAIAEAVDHMEHGDVLLLEVQRPGEGGTRPLPTEIDPADFDAISDATGAGIVVVEAAGNGTRDLDLWRHPTDGPLRAMRRDGPGDSQAIIVGSCVAQRFQDGHARFPDSNWGERVDCYAWGESVATAFATASTADYTTGFNGTSAASAIVAGVAVATQGMQRAAHPGSPLDSPTMREYLSGPANTPQRPATDKRHIGRMPNLAALATRIGAAECGAGGDGGAGGGGVIG
jgi:subtilisin family serine protease